MGGFPGEEGSRGPVGTASAGASARHVVAELPGISRTVPGEMKAENGQTMPEPWHLTDKIQAETGMQRTIAWAKQAEVKQAKLPPFNAVVE